MPMSKTVHPVMWIAMAYSWTTLASATRGVVLKKAVVALGATLRTIRFIVRVFKVQRGHWEELLKVQEGMLSRRRNYCNFRLTVSSNCTSRLLYDMPRRRQLCSWMQSTYHRPQT